MKKDNNIEKKLIGIIINKSRNNTDSIVKKLKNIIENDKINITGESNFL